MNALHSDLQPHHLPDAPDPPRMSWDEWASDNPKQADAIDADFDKRRLPDLWNELEAAKGNNELALVAVKLRLARRAYRREALDRAGVEMREG